MNEQYQDSAIHIGNRPPLDGSWARGPTSANPTPQGRTRTATTIAATDGAH